MKILLIDLETTALKAFSWGPSWETSLIEIIEHTTILSYSAKWLDGKHITKGWPDYKGYKKGKMDDKEIVKDLWKLLDETEVVIAQNGKAFDIKIMNARFLYHSMIPPSPYKVIDTMTEARKYLRLPSYKLNDMCDYLGIGRKKEHEGFPLWKKCIAGDRKAWKRMLAYNKHDIVLTEQLYLRLRPFISNHPNMNVYEGTIGNCPNCGSNQLIRRGYNFARSHKRIRYRCKSCGAWSSGDIVKTEVEVK